MLILPSRKCFTVAALTYLVLICIVSIPRVTGASWRSIITPMAMRNLELYPVQWEATLVLRSLYAMSAPTTPDDLIEWFSTDEYRALLPIYFAAITTQITHSYIFGITISEIAWWWLGALGVLVLVRKYASTTVAYCAGLMTCFTPLGTGHIGSSHLHTASSLSLSVYLALAIHVLYSTAIASNLRSVYIAIILFLSSITYTYQWFLIPFLFLLTLTERTRRENFLIVMWSTLLFMSLRWISYAMLGLGGLSVHVHQNDPLRVVLYNLGSILYAQHNVLLQILSFLYHKFFVVIQMLPSSFGQLPLAVAVSGSLHQQTRSESSYLLLGFVLSGAFAAIYGIPWVLMSSYPMFYHLASKGIVYGINLIVYRGHPYQTHSRRGVYAAFAMHIIAALLLGLTTNFDLFQIHSFSVAWWGGWYIPH